MAKKPKKKKAQDPTNLALQRPDPNAMVDHSNLPLPSKQVDEAVVEVGSHSTESPPVPTEEEETPVPVSQVEPSPQPAPISKPVPSPVPKPDSPKPAITLETISNADGEAFSAGDKILVTAPWGEKAIAQITSLYQSPSDTWAQYQPIAEELPTGWSWLGGVCRAESLVRVD